MRWTCQTAGGHSLWETCSDLWETCSELLQTGSDVLQACADVLQTGTAVMLRPRCIGTGRIGTGTAGRRCTAATKGVDGSKLKT